MKEKIHFLIKFLLLLVKIYEVHSQHQIIFPDTVFPIIKPQEENDFKEEETNTTSFIDDYDIILDRLRNLTEVKNFNTQAIQPAISSPKFSEYYECGRTTKDTGRYYGIIEDEYGEENHPIYYLNQTAEELFAKGFQIIVNEVVNDDVLKNFTYTNGTFESTIAFTVVVTNGGYVVGGERATVARSYYMAQLGERKRDIINWLCDGVLINSRWILSAAHCFTSPGVNPNVVRLGDLDLSDSSDPHQVYGPKFIRDYPIHQRIMHPEFNVKERYHDLVLIQIPREIPKNGPNFKPICLPWDSETNKNLVGEQVALTGWGGLQYGGQKTEVLQELFLKVFDTKVCDSSYSNLHDYNNIYPKGITEDKILCVGWEEGGKDACGGDSGAPIVYLKIIGRPDVPSSKRNYILAGIVSRGYGCGLKEYPGLYIPINKPKYLQWIKDVAFKDYV